MRRRIVQLLTFFAILSAVPLIAMPQGTPTTCIMLEVYDGDTITVEVDGERFKCRLLGVDTPELSYARLWMEMDKVKKYAPLEGRKELHEAEKVFRKWAPVAEKHGRQAREALAEMVKGKAVAGAGCSEAHVCLDFPAAQRRITIAVNGS